MYNIIRVYSSFLSFFFNFLDLFQLPSHVSFHCFLLFSFVLKHARDII